MRLFVAVFPPEDARIHLQRRLAELHIAAPAGRGPRVRRTPMQRWHVTLAFLGELPGARRPDVEAAVQRAVHDRRPPRLRVAGGGSFGRGRSTVLWAGLAGDVDALTDLHADLRAALAAADLPYDGRPLVPHLTVAFPGDRLDAAAVAADVRALSGYRGPEWTADEVVLVDSGVPGGGGYEPVRVWPLR